MAKDFVETLLSLSKLVEGLNFLRFPRDISPSPSLPSSLEKRGKKNKERKEGRKKGASVSHRFRRSIYPKWRG